ncbi:ABC transporter permease [Olsenella urininfantis]|uniref:ABC transporter permease n=1 Tax=Olsenella urininfantis TaxID=1871033 RepID=UPI0009875AE4|nr:FtsX-like permease family protein [Olsenella urininfantis]
MSALDRRLPRELVHNLGRYLGLFLLIGLTVSMISGYLVAARSTQRVIAQTRASSNVEDFSFTTQFKPSQDDLRAVQDLRSGCKAYESFHSDVKVTLVRDGQKREATIRLAKNRTDVNKASYLAGEAPTRDDQIALSRCFCENNGLAVGDKITVSGRELTISGLVSLPDYQALVKKNSDLMFDCTGFSMAQLTPTAFDALAGPVTYRYSVTLDPKLELKDRNDFELRVAEKLDERGVTLTELRDSKDNTAMNFAEDDLEGDQVGWIFICGIILVICAFVFVVLTNASIEQESAVIGTLLASGYRKGELVAHYMVLPTLVGLAAGAVGNALGYGFLVEYMSGLYYHSYDLPTYVTYFSMDVFLMTTVAPVGMLILVTLLGLLRKLGHTPLAFLRHELQARTRRANLALPERWGFTSRFRLRVFLRNFSHFALLFMGIALSVLLLLFGLCMLPIVRNFSGKMAANVPAQHLYLLKAPLEIDVSSEDAQAARALDELQDYERPEDDLPEDRYLSLLMRASALSGDARIAAGHPVNTSSNSENALEHAEKFSVRSLELPRLHSDSNEEVSLYGIDVGSEYWKMDVSGGKIVVGAGLAEKCGLHVGRQFTFTNPRTGDSYVLAPDVIAGNDTDMNVYMSRENWCQIFGKDASYFNGYASDVPLALNERYLASEMTPQQMDMIAVQLESSMSDVMGMLLWLAIPISIILIYLLTKTVIDRSARYISYMKVFGYRDGEIQALYLRSITVTVLVSLIASVPLVIAAVGQLMVYVMSDYAGNMPFVYPSETLLEVMGIVAATYFLVACVHVWRIRRVSLAEALKVQE